MAHMKIDLMKFKPLIEIVRGKQTRSKFVRSALAKHMKNMYYFENRGDGSVAIYENGIKIGTITEEQLLNIWED